MTGSLLLLTLASLGLVNAAILRLQYFWEKRGIRKMYCLIGSDCFDVLNSRYGRLLRVKNEDVGLVYYLVLILIGIVSFAADTNYLFSVPVVALTFGALIFSIYLLFVQVYVLKKSCFWCLASIAINTVIFVVSFSELLIL